MKKKKLRKTNSCITGGGINYGSNLQYSCHPRIYQTDDATIEQPKHTNLNINCHDCTQNLEYVTDQYLDNNLIIPNWYFDMTKKTIAKHPMVNRNIKETDIPNILTSSLTQLEQHQLDCQQPKWLSSCI